MNKEQATKHKRFIFFSVNGIVSAVFLNETERGKELEECIKEMNEKDTKYAYEKVFINYLIHAQTVYWENHGLTVIWSTHEELYDDLEGLH